MVDKFNNSLNNMLAEGRLGHIINTLRRNLEAKAPLHPDLLPLSAELDGVADTYSRLRNFLLQGNPDPDRERIYDSLKERLSAIANHYLFIINETRSDAFFTEYRIQKIRNVDLSSLADELRKVLFRIDMASKTEADPAAFLQKREELIEKLFLRIWTLPPRASAELGVLDGMLADDELPFELKAQIISALLLGLLKFHDEEKFHLLLKFYNSASDERLAARALVAIVLVLARRGNALLSSPQVREQLMSLSCSLLTYSRLKEVVMVLLRTRDTDRVSREVTEAFNTTMKEISPELLEKLRREGMAVDSAETGMNPEWEKIMKNKEIEEKMKAINDMQLEGMDVMMQTFSRLKHFSFFRSVPNWFLPFSSSHPVVKPLFDSFSEESFSVMADATEMCSGDRFSFVLGILQMPENRRNLLAAQVGAAMEQANDLVKDRENVRRKSLFNAEVLSFARDLYRFAKVFPKNQDFYDPFDAPLDFLGLPMLGSLLSEDEVVLSAADFYFDHGYYSLALPLFEEATASGTAERHIFEKIGYCCQMASDYVGALSAYEKADLFSSDVDQSSTWLIKRLAFCNKALGRYREAADYYRRLLERDPDDTNVEFHLGSVLLNAGDLQEASDLISKLHYLYPDNNSYTRAYIRLLISRVTDGDFENVYNAAVILANQAAAEPADIRLAAHAAFLSGRLGEAADLYAKASPDTDEADFRRNVVAELSSLTPAFDITTLRIILDR